MEQEVIIFNTFSNMKKIKQFPEFDLLVWTISLLQYKKFGYKTKLFCEEKDIGFLKEWRLFELYDEIDTTLFATNEMIRMVDETKFWSVRKIEAINYQLQLNPMSIYSDVDVVMNSPFYFRGCDVFAWSEEISDENENGVYVNWGYLTFPKGYKMPEYIVREHDAINCGILWFKHFNVFKKFRKEYYKFVIGNPCEIHIPTAQYAWSDDCYACNAEQRILRAILTHYKERVRVVAEAASTGITDNGNHFYKLRANLRKLDKYAHSDDQKDRDYYKNILKLFNNIIERCYYYLTYYPDYFDFWDQKEWLRTFLDRREEDSDGIAIWHYV